MHVTVFGAGALGRVYGVRLARSGADVSFVVRPSRLAETAPIAIEQVNGKKQRDAIDAPQRVADVPRYADVVLVTVRFDQLDGRPAAAADARPAPGAGASEGSSENARAIVALLRQAPPVPLVVLTPLLPRQQRSLEEAVGRPIVPAMPGVSGYVDDRGVVRYWLVGVVSTLVQDPGAEIPRDRHAVLEDLAKRLTEAGLPTRLERDVGTLNVATTTAFFPLIAAIDAGGGIDGVLSDRELLGTAMSAAKETEALARALGPVATWTNMLLRFVGPFTLKPGIALARRAAPESVRFVEAHFGPKLHEQHLAMGETILAMGRERGMAMPSLDALMSRLRNLRRG